MARGHISRKIRCCTGKGDRDPWTLDGESSFKKEGASEGVWVEVQLKEQRRRNREMMDVVHQESRKRT